MKQPSGMYGRYTVGQLAEKLANSIEVQRGQRGLCTPGRSGSSRLEEVDTVDPLHREEPAPLLLEQLPEPDQVRVPQVLQRAELVLEAVSASARNCCKVFNATMASCSRS